MTRVNPITEKTLRFPMLSPRNTDYDTQVDPITEMTPVKVAYDIHRKLQL